MAIGQRHGDAWTNTGRWSRMPCFATALAIAASV
jgi:hypothetical protein